MAIDPRVVGGGADAQAIVETVRAEKERLPELSKSSPESPLESAFDVLRPWLALSPAQSAPLVLVFSSVPREDFGRVPGRQHRAFAPDAPRVMHPGCIYVCTRSLGRAVEYEQHVASASEAADHLERLALDFLPALVILNDLQPRAFWYPHGMADADAVMTFDLQPEGDTRVSLESVDEMVTLHYELHLKTPLAGGAVWHSPDDRVPVRNAERHIQRGLWIAAKARFGRSHRIRIEDPTPSGRTDVLLTTLPDVPTASGAALIELKVLREKHYSEVPRDAARCPEQENRNGIAKGIAQASEYGEEQGCDLRFLCLFDMRAEDDDGAILAAFRDDAAQLSVICRRYFLYASSDEARDAEMRRRGLVSLANASAGGRRRTDDMPRRGRRRNSDQG